MLGGSELEVLGVLDVDVAAVDVAAGDVAAGEVAAGAVAAAGGRTVLTTAADVAATDGVGFAGSEESAAPPACAQPAAMASTAPSAAAGRTVTNPAAS